MKKKWINEWCIFTKFDPCHYNSFNNSFVYYSSLLNIFLFICPSDSSFISFQFPSFLFSFLFAFPLFFSSIILFCLTDKWFLNTYYMTGTDVSSKIKIVKNADSFPVFSEEINKQTVNNDYIENVNDTKKKSCQKKRKKKFVDSSWHYFKRWSGKISLRKRHLSWHLSDERKQYCL